MFYGFFFFYKPLEHSLDPYKLKQVETKMKRLGYFEINGSGFNMLFQIWKQSLACLFVQMYTPLHAAAASGQISVVKLLLELGVEVDAVNIYGNTALHVACLNGQDIVVSKLLEFHAAINAVNHKGMVSVIGLFCELLWDRKDFCSVIGTISKGKFKERERENKTKVKEEKNPASVHAQAIWSVLSALRAWSLSVSLQLFYFFVFCFVYCCLFVLLRFCFDWLRKFLFPSMHYFN